MIHGWNSEYGRQKVYWRPSLKDSKDNDVLLL